MPIGLSVFTGTVDGSSSADAEVDVQLVGGDPSGPSVPADIASGRLPSAQGEALSGLRQTFYDIRDS